MFVGSESFLLANMRNGGAGTISATANVNPAAIYELYTVASAVSADIDLEPQQARLNVVREVFAAEVLAVDDRGVKTGDCDLRERSGMGQSATAASRAHDRAGEIARRSN